jgi:hypothetical protein
VTYTDDPYFGRTYHDPGENEAFQYGLGVGYEAHRAEQEAEAEYAAARLESTIYHEAGHAAACLVLGVQVLIATVEPTPAYAGHVRHAYSTDEKHSIIGAAGLAAQTRAGYIPDRATESSDRRHVLERGGCWDTASWFAENLIEKHWALVEEIAAALRLEPTLSEATLRRLGFTYVHSG